MSRPEKITPLDCLSFIYVVAMHHDGDADDSEIEILVEKLSEWVNDLDAVHKSAKQAMHWHSAASGRGREAVAQEFFFCLAIVKEQIDNKQAILLDLVAIFEADGKVTEGEQAMFDAMCEALS
ncbi:MAG: TerB family tellurite resistance protein [Bacteroidota bacterium]